MLVLINHLVWVVYLLDIIWVTRVFDKFTVKLIHRHDLKLVYFWPLYWLSHFLLLYRLFVLAIHDSGEVIFWPDFHSLRLSWSCDTTHRLLLLCLFDLYRSFPYVASISLIRHAISVLGCSILSFHIDRVSFCEEGTLVVLSITWLFDGGFLLLMGEVLG